MNLHLDPAVGHAKVFEQIECGHACGVLRGIFRQLAVVTGDLGDVQAGFFRMTDDDFIARRVDGESEDVVTAGNVRHRGWSENADFLGVGHDGKWREARSVWSSGA